MHDNKNLEQIEKKISSLKKEKQEKEEKKHTKNHKQEGMRAAMEFILSILVSAYIGYWIDNYFNTTPAFIFIFVILGTATGFMAIYKISNNLDSSIGYSSLHNSKKNVKETLEKNSNE